MYYETLLVRKGDARITITLNLLAKRNSISNRLIKELNEVLDQAERDASCRMVILEGQKGVFCTGMDFEEVVSGDKGAGGSGLTYRYMETLRRLSLIPKVVIARVEGQVMAGGVGLAAASDLVVASPESQFSLSEALWGLLPSMVIPYLIRRVGFQQAYSMTLTTLPVSAREALAVHLVDDVSENLDESIQRLSSRLVRLEEHTIANMKRYFRRMWMITEEMEQAAAAETTRLVASPVVQQNIANYVNHKLFPWETRKNS
ncbi:MAG TPA: enoyl-CoA hydratase-related protein [Symbiobacteriaceae bacterium]|jgi:polyketide biosynthesis enoyl-CoA hydratase PksH